MSTKKPKQFYTGKKFQDLNLFKYQLDVVLLCLCGLLLFLIWMESGILCTYWCHVHYLSICMEWT